MIVLNNPNENFIFTKWGYLSDILDLSPIYMLYACASEFMIFIRTRTKLWITDIEIGIETIYSDKKKV